MFWQHRPQVTTRILLVICKNGWTTLLKKANEEAAKRFILNRLHESESRSRISRRVFIEDALDDAQIEHTEEDIEDLAEREESVLDDSSSDNTDSQE